MNKSVDLGLTPSFFNGCKSLRLRANLVSSSHFCCFLDKATLQGHRELCPWCWSSGFHRIPRHGAVAGSPLKFTPFWAIYKYSTPPPTFFFNTFEHRVLMLILPVLWSKQWCCCFPLRFLCPRKVAPSHTYLPAGFLSFLMNHFYVTCLFFCWVLFHFLVNLRELSAHTIVFCSTIFPSL